MTNGEKIKEIFPNAEIDPDPYSPSIDIYFGSILIMRVDRNWWNAKYQEPITCDYCRHRRANDVGDYYCDITGGYYDPDYHCKYAEVRK